MNERIQELYKSCRSKEALASQEQFQSANVLLGTEVEKFAELIVLECIQVALKADNEDQHYAWFAIQKHFGVEE